MSDLIPVSFETLKNKSWRRPKDLSHGARDTFCPLTLSELARAATSFPIAFVPNGDSYSLVAVQSFELGKNLFTSPDGRWLSNHIPVSYSTYPFRLAPTQEGDVVFCILNENKCVLDDGSEHPFFDSEGNLDPLVNEVFRTLSQAYNESDSLARIVTLLRDMELIVPWEVTISKGNKNQQIDGLFRVDEKALNSLSEVDFLRLRNNGALVPAHCQLISMQLLPELIKLDQAYSQLVAADQTIAPDELRIGLSEDSGTLDLSNL